MPDEVVTGLVEATDGWKDLVSWLNEKTAPKRTVAGLAAMLSVSQPAARGWFRRLSRPTKGPLRDAVCRIIGSSPERWETEAEKLQRRKLSKIAARRS